MLSLKSSTGAGPETTTTSRKWARPSLSPPLDPKTDKVVFQQIDVDSYVGKFNDISLNFVLNTLR